MIVDEYFKFKQNNILNYCFLLYKNDLDKSYQTKLFNTYITIYINSYYFQIYETLSNDTTITGFKVITKELEGKHLEIKRDLDRNNHIKTENTYERYSKLVENCYIVAVVAITLDLLDYNNCNSLDDYYNQIKIITDSVKKEANIKEDDIKLLSQAIKNDLIKQEKFLTSLNYESFSIKKLQYKENRKCYLLKLKHNISKINENYNKNSISKNFKNEQLAEEKVITTLNLINIEILNNLIRRREVENYLIKLDHPTDVEKLLKQFKNAYIRKHINLITNYSDYTKNKNYYKKLDKINIAINIDFSRIIDITKKLDELNTYNCKYIIINNIKPTDYKKVQSYSFTKKQVFQNELEEE